MAEYIEREKAYELARTSDYYSDFHKSMADLTSLKELLDDTPAADVVEVKHGEWIFKSDPINNPKGYFIRIICSECGLKTGQKSKYCPNCGAKMDGDTNG